MNKKSFSDTIFPKRYPLKHFFRIMRISAFLLFLFVFCLSAENSNSQNVNVTLKSNNMELEKVLSEIEKQTDFLFVYNNHVNVTRKVSVNLKKASLEKTLDNLFKGTDVKYSIDGTYILLSTKDAVTNASLIPSSEAAVQQKRTVTGKIIDEKGEPIIGANILIRGTSNGAISDADGKFSISPIESRDILEISYIGYISQQIQVGQKSNFLIKLIENSKSLEEVVVVGYGTQKKLNLTGSVGSVKTDEALKSRPVTNVQELLAGTVPGMVVSKSSGAAGSGASLNIRGTSTIGSSSGVLVLIDGMPGNMYTLNPNDIESVSVLKDAASSSIYGSRAANGVILITTKTSQNLNRPLVEVSTSVGIQNPQFMIDFVGAEDYMKLYDQALVNDGKSAMYGDKGLTDLKSGKYADIKWYKEIYKKNTLINNNYVALSGKESSILYRFSVSNDNQDGTLPNNKYNRIIIKPDLTFTLMKNLTLTTNVQYTQTILKEPDGGTSLWQSESSRVSPLTKIKEDNGLYAVGSAMVGNPIATVNEGGFSSTKYKELFGIFEAKYTPITDLNIKVNFSTYNNDEQNKNKVNTYYLYDADGNIAKTVNLTNSMRQSFNSSYRNMLQFTTDYTKSFNGHNMKALGGYSQEYYRTSNFWASRQNFPFENVDELDVANANKQNGGNANDVAIQSLFGRFNYDFKGIYLFEANVRADGSSRFAKGHRWGVFPSFSVGWNINREHFLRNVSWLSELKIRASWGTLGDAEKVGYYATSSILSYNPSIYTFNDKLFGGAYNSVSINKNISWEKAQMTNLGLDFGVFNQKIKLSIDYFNNLRKDILYQAPVPLEFGLPAPYSNLLKMRNEGMEFLVNYGDKKGDFFWNVNLNASYSKNKALNLGYKEYWIEGNAITYLNDQYQLPYGYEAIGLFESVDDVKNSASQGPNVFPGNIKYKDQNSDGKIDGQDRVVLNSKVPIRYGFSISLGYKDFDFSANMYGTLNTKRYISGYEGWAFYLSQNARPMHKNAWTETNKNATYPRLTLQYTSNDTKYSNYWLRKADYMKIQNLQFGYSIPKPLLSKLNIQYLRIYLSCQNLATITSYDGFDPEGGFYPLSRTFSFGLNLKF